MRRRQQPVARGSKETRGLFGVCDIERVCDIEMESEPGSPGLGWNRPALLGPVWTERPSQAGRSAAFPLEALATLTIPGFRQPPCPRYSCVKFTAGGAWRASSLVLK